MHNLGNHIEHPKEAFYVLYRIISKTYHNNENTSLSVFKVGVVCMNGSNKNKIKKWKRNQALLKNVHWILIIPREELCCPRTSGL